MQMILSEVIIFPQILLLLQLGMINLEVIIILTLVELQLLIIILQELLLMDLHQCQILHLQISIMVCLLYLTIIRQVF